MAILLELLSFLSPLARLVQSVSTRSWETALTGGLIPLVQFSWKWWHQRSLENQREKLREKVVSLQRFLQALKDETENTAAVKLSHDARLELEETLPRLAQLVTDKGVPRTSAPNLFQRWFLFYTPTGFVSLILHILFYICLAITVLISSVVVPIGARDWEVLGGIGTAAGMWVVFLLMIRTVAVAVDTPGKTSRLERWLLLYKPSHPAGWILRLFFYVSFTVVLLFAAILIPTLSFDKEWGSALFGFGVFAAVPLSLRVLIALLERTREPNRFERWVLLYRPKGLVGWILRITFYLSLSVALLLLALLPSDINDPDADLQGGIGALALFSVVSFLSRGLAVALEQTRAPKVWERWLLLYKPARRTGWIVHSLFYLCVSSLMTLVPALIFERKSADAGFLIGALVMFAFLVILFRGFALNFDPNASGSATPGRLCRLLLIYSPCARAAWILHILFYWILGSALFGLGVAIKEPDPEDLFAMGYMLLIALAIRQIATDYGPPPIASSRWAKWMMLGRPSHPLGWIPRTILYFAALSLPPMVVGTLQDANDKFALRALRENADFVLGALVPAILIAIASRGWAESYELPESSLHFSLTGRMRTIRKAFLLYTPSRSAGWIPHTLFYLAGVILITTATNSSTLRMRNRYGMPVFELMLVCLLVSAWGWARGYRSTPTTLADPEAGKWELINQLKQKNQL